MARRKRTERQNTKQFKKKRNNSNPALICESMYPEMVHRAYPLLAFIHCDTTDSETQLNLDIDNSTLILLILFIENIHHTANATGLMDKEEYCMSASCIGVKFVLSKENCIPDYKVICGNLVV
jgi:hypothetical protein